MVRQQSYQRLKPMKLAEFRQKFLATRNVVNNVKAGSGEVSKKVGDGTIPPPKVTTQITTADIGYLTG